MRSFLGLALASALVLGAAADARAQFGLYVGNPGYGLGNYGMGMGGYGMGGYGLGAYNGYAVGNYNSYGVGGYGLGGYGLGVAPATTIYRSGYYGVAPGVVPYRAGYGVGYRPYGYGYRRGPGLFRPFGGRRY